jgi:Mn2+/Fe2+ NRAMP family transporter
MGIHTNSRTANAIGWATAVVIGTLAIVYVAQSIQSAMTGS